MEFLNILQKHNLVESIIHLNLLKKENIFTPQSTNKTKGENTHFSSLLVNCLNLHGALEQRINNEKEFEFLISSTDVVCFFGDEF